MFDQIVSILKTRIVGVAIVFALASPLLTSCATPDAPKNPPKVEARDLAPGQSYSSRKGKTQIKLGDDAAVIIIGTDATYLLVNSYAKAVKTKKHPPALKWKEDPYEVYIRTFEGSDCAYFKDSEGNQWTFPPGCKH